MLEADTGSGELQMPTQRGLMRRIMDSLTIFGLFAVSAMLVCYAFENRSPWFVFWFAGACALASVYGFLQGAWLFGLVEAVWTAVAVRRWRTRTTRKVRERR
jgi:CHASE2 domain-containing sensor protein